MGKFSLKKIAILVMSVVMMFSMTVPVMAATGANSPTGAVKATTKATTAKATTKATTAKATTKATTTKDTTKATTKVTAALAAKASISKTTASVAKKKLTVNYKGENAVKYRIAYKKVGAKKWSYKTVKSKSYALKVKKGAMYQVKVAGVNKDGKVGKYSAVTYRYINGTKAAAKAKKKAIKVTAKAKNVTGYYINYSKNKNMSNSKCIKVKGKKLNKTIKKLKKGTYYVQVRPYKVKAGKKYVGVALNKKKVTVK